MGENIHNIFKVFSTMISNPKLEREHLIIPRSDLKIIKSMYDHYDNGHNGTSYVGFLSVVVDISLKNRIHYLKTAEVVSKRINNING